MLRGAQGVFCLQWLHTEPKVFLSADALCVYLDLHGDLPPVPQHPLMHLADGSSSKGLVFERGQLLSPVGTQVLL